MNKCYFCGWDIPNIYDEDICLQCGFSLNIDKDNFEVAACKRLIETNADEPEVWAKVKDEEYIILKDYGL
jgi:hypothetical protein